jgi:flavodoxin
MKALVVYDSVYGNTEKVAQAIGDVLGAPTLRVGDVKPEHLIGLDALIVGSPTRGFSPTPAVKKWLKNLASHSLVGTKVAAFDTRGDVREVNSRAMTTFVEAFGYAARPIATWLAKKGGVQAMPPTGFIVEEWEGPWRDGELERAVEWARQMQK